MRIVAAMLLATVLACTMGCSEQAAALPGCSPLPALPSPPPSSVRGQVEMVDFEERSSPYLLCRFLAQAHSDPATGSGGGGSLSRTVGPPSTSPRAIGVDPTLPSSDGGRYLAAVGRMFGEALSIGMRVSELHLVSEEPAIRGTPATCRTYEVMSNCRRDARRSLPAGSRRAARRPSS